MNNLNIPRLRLQSQHISQPSFTSAHSVVGWMGAMQAQDYEGALWAIALRTPNLTKQDVEQAIENREIVRTWPMRGTLHFVAAEDIHWMVQLLAPRATATAATRRKNLGLDDSTINHAKEIVISSLSNQPPLTRSALFEAFDHNGIISADQRGNHLLRYFAETGLICFGPHLGKQPTFVLLDEWILPPAPLDREESLVELTKRYFYSHGPASLRDFAGWGSLTLKDARIGLELAKNDLLEIVLDDVTYWLKPTTFSVAKPGSYLLPGFDEYMLGYKNRSAALDLEHSQKIVPGNNGMFLPTIVIDGKVEGLWKRAQKKDRTDLTLAPFYPLTQEAQTSLQPAIDRYSAYLQMPIKTTQLE